MPQRKKGEPLELHLRNHFRTTGMRRAGNHAIQLWIIGLCPPPVVKLNWCPNIGGLRRDEFLVQYAGPETSLVQGAEDLMRCGAHQDLVLVPENHRNVVILRNPINLYRYSEPDADIPDEHIPKFLKTWMLYAEEFLGLTSTLSDRVAVNFDRWFAEIDYRRQLAKKLGVEFSDKNLNKMDTAWGGSSFDNFEFQGRAQEMKVLDRWRVYAKHKRFHGFVRALKAHEAFALFTRIYGGLPKELQGTR